MGCCCPKETQETRPDETVVSPTDVSVRLADLTTAEAGTRAQTTEAPHTEVRLVDSTEVFSSIQTAVSEALAWTFSSNPEEEALDEVQLSYEVVQNITGWWNGEISSDRCVENIIALGVNVATGTAGKLAGGVIGASIGGPVGMFVGAAIGSAAENIVSSMITSALPDRSTHWAFGLPKREALDNAYKFLDVSPTSSNSEINSRYRKLTLQYHPDKGGDKDMWTRLQYSMAIIREEREKRKIVVST